MKSILISIKPEYVEKILNGEKTLEIRLTVPKEWKEYLNGKTSIKPEPSEWYIYCTNGYMLYDLRNEDYLELKNNFTLDITHKSNKYLSSNPPMLNRRVVAKFTLNEINYLPSIRYKANGAFYQYNKVSDEILKKSCLTQEQILNYTNGKDLYALRIDDLKIYDKPKELSEFSVGKVKIDCGYGNYNIYNKILQRPPQSWCYVESLEGK